MRLSMLLAGALTLAGCAAPHQVMDRDDALAEQQRVFPGETQERVIRAAELVLKTSDPGDFEFRDNANGFVGLRRYFIYAVFATASGREKWEFTADPSPAGIRAFVSISEAGTTTDGYVARPYEQKMASIPLYRLFWNRVEYVLGRRDTWITCDAAAAWLQQNNTNTVAGLGGLCGPTSDGRDAPAPEPFPKLAKR